MTTAPIPTAELERLIDLGEKATSAPWRVFGKATGYIHGRDDTSDRRGDEVLVARVGAYSDKELLHFNRDRWDADCAFIAAARRADALAAELIAAREALADLIAKGKHFRHETCWPDDDSPELVAFEATMAEARRLLPSAAQETE